MFPTRCLPRFRFKIFIISNQLLQGLLNILLPYHNFALSLRRTDDIFHEILENIVILLEAHLLAQLLRITLVLVENFAFRYDSLSEMKKCSEASIRIMLIGHQ